MIDRHAIDQATSLLMLDNVRKTTLFGFHAQQALEKCLIPHAVDMDRYKHEIK